MSIISAQQLFNTVNGELVSCQRRYDMNGIFQMQGGKNWILPKYINANRFFWDSHWLEIWSNHFCPSTGPNGGCVATDSGQKEQGLSAQPASLRCLPLGSKLFQGIATMTYIRSHTRPSQKDLGCMVAPSYSMISCMQSKRMQKLHCKLRPARNSL